MSTPPAHLRIGALSRRVGVSPELLRAWEQRYGLVRPLRSRGGFRLYSHADEERVRSMRRHLDAGVSAAEAARLALAETTPDQAEGPESADLERLSLELRGTLDRLDDPNAQACFDRLLATFTLETVLRDVLLPYLHELGERWDQGEATVAQEHFASNVLRGRLLGLARDWGRGGGPRAMLACAPGELHDLPLIMFGLVLARRGWVITYLGPDTPIATIEEHLADVEPRLVVIAAATTRRLRAAQPRLTELARHVSLALAGAGATAAIARATGAVVLEGDPVTAAERVADEHR
ncbi:MAG TPA: cobalamin B12-binding domain-containing protein [Miltoncostaeaceae bacterium]|nr:cobalamin B12-binding domain-containing protein [Miltoncostaeaceae bacterium]